jgi:VanZ family protein
VVLVMGAIFAASSIPNMNALPGGLSDHHWHFIAYAVLAASTLRALAGTSWTGVTFPAAAAAWLITVTYGATDEWHQTFVPGRVAAFDDLAADALGALAAVLIALAGAVGRRLEDRKV